MLYWIVTSDSQSFYSGKDTLCISSVVLTGSCFRQPFTFEFGVRVGFLVLVHLRRSSVFPASSLSAKWADSPRASSQVNGLSSREFKKRSGLTVRVHLRRSTAGPARITIFLHFRNH